MTVQPMATDSLARSATSRLARRIRSLGLLLGLAPLLAHAVPLAPDEGAVPDMIDPATLGTGLGIWYQTFHLDDGFGDTADVQVTEYVNRLSDGTLAFIDRVWNSPDSSLSIGIKWGAFAGFTTDMSYFGTGDGSAPTLAFREAVGTGIPAGFCFGAIDPAEPCAGLVGNSQFLVVRTNARTFDLNGTTSIWSFEPGYVSQYLAGSPEPVPEVETLAMMGLGLAAASLARRR